MIHSQKALIFLDVQLKLGVWINTYTLLYLK